MKNYHAEIISISLKNKKMLKKYPVIDVEKRFLGLIKIVKIVIPENVIESVTKEFQYNMSTALKKEWYITFHTDEQAIIVFREKMFTLSAEGINPIHYKRIDASNAKEKEQWETMIAYAKSIGVPDEQCDFLPQYFKNENYMG